MRYCHIVLIAVIVAECGMCSPLFAQKKIDDSRKWLGIKPYEYALINDTTATEGVVPLFDGKTLNGWVQRGGKAKYTVEDGMIVGETVPKTSNSFLCTEKEYGDFVLDLDFKVDPELNSGVQFRSECFDKPTTVKVGDKEIKIPAGRVHGYQCEIDMDSKKARWWTAGIYDEARRLWLYPGALGGDEKAFTEQGAKISKQNQWNHLRIAAIGDSIKTWLNDVPAAELKDSMTLKGFVALQVHAVGDRQEALHVYFKNIRIKELNAKDINTEK
jgi:hypothetical protein